MNFHKNEMEFPIDFSRDWADPFFIHEADLKVLWWGGFINKSDVVCINTQNYTEMI